MEQKPKQISVQLLNGLLQYLAQRPFGEVYELINAIQNLQDAEDTTVKDEGTKGE